MKAYRIGRKQGSWVNRTPPIRGGVFVKANPIVDGSSSSDTEDDSADDGISQISSLCSCGLSHKDAKEGKEGLRHRGPCPTQTQGPNQKPSAHTLVANAALEREIQNDLSIYPSLDPLVQEEIARKYQILHQQITDAGLYDCPYIDYAKEMARYTLLFTTFAVLVSYGWYLTSAIFLGLFWVCPHPRSLKYSISNMLSINSCLPPTMVDISPLPPTLLSTLSLPCSSPTFAAVSPSDGGRAVTTSTTLSPTIP